MKAYEYAGPAQIEQGSILSPEFQLDDGEYYIELKVLKHKPKKTSLTSTIGKKKFDEFVAAFWARYPKRRGSHFNKRLAVEKLNELTRDDVMDVLRGAANYAQTEQAVKGFAIDAHRWLQRREWEGFQQTPEKEGNSITL